MKVKILTFEHWCTDNCGAEVLEQHGIATKVRRWKVTIVDTPYAYAFNTEAEAQEFSTRYGYEVIV